MQCSGKQLKPNTEHQLDHSADRVVHPILFLESDQALPICQPTLNGAKTPEPLPSRQSDKSYHSLRGEIKLQACMSRRRVFKEERMDLTISLNPQIRSALRWVKISKPHRDYLNSRTTAFISGSTSKSRTVAAPHETCQERKTFIREETTTTHRKPIKLRKRPAKDSIVCAHLQLQGAASWNSRPSPPGHQMTVLVRPTGTANVRFIGTAKNTLITHQLSRSKEEK